MSCVAILAVVTWGLLWPDPYMPLEGFGMQSFASVSDTMQHCTVFAVLTMVMATLGQRVSQPVARLVVFLLLYSAMTEVLQILVPGRTADLRDLAANTAGIATGLICIRAVGAALRREHAAGRAVY